jgi:uncharacterized protein (TIGR03067 family)
VSRWRWPLVLALAVPVAAAAFPPLPKPKDKPAAAKDLRTAIQGRWDVVKLERGGTGRAAGEMPKPQVRFKFDGAKVTRTATSGDRKSDVSLTLELDAKKSPAWLDLTAGDGPASRRPLRGVVKVDGDRMVWVYTTGGGKRLDKVDGELPARYFRYTLKRVKP